MSHTVRLTDTAKQDLREIVFGIADQSKDAEIAKRFVEELRTECKKLDTSPYAGSLPKDRILKVLAIILWFIRNILYFILWMKKRNK